jgi:hypothetical protein
MKSAIPAHPGRGFVVAVLVAVALAGMILFVMAPTFIRIFRP